MQPQHIEIPLDRDAVYAAIWPALAGDVHIFAATDFLAGHDHVNGVEGDALGWLLDEIAGKAMTPWQAISMAIELMTPRRDVDWLIAQCALEDAFHAVSAMPPDLQHKLITDLILDADDPLLLITDLYDRIRQELDARRRNQKFYHHLDAYQLIKAVTGREAAGVPLSEFERDVLHDLEPDDDRG